MDTKQKLRGRLGIRYLMITAVSLAVVWMIAHTLLRPWFVSEKNGRFQIMATAEKREESFGTDVRIQEIRVNGHVIPMETLMLEDGWEITENGICMTVLPQDPTSVWFEADHVRKLEIDFVVNCGSGIVRIMSGEEALEEFDLFSEEYQNFPYVYYVREVSLLKNPVPAVVTFLLGYLLLYGMWKAAEVRKQGRQIKRRQLLKRQIEVTVYYLIFAVVFGIMDIADSALAYWDEKQLWTAVVFLYFMTFLANVAIVCEQEEEVKNWKKRLVDAAGFLACPPILFVTFEIIQDSGWKSFQAGVCLGNLIVFGMVFATFVLLLGDIERAAVMSLLLNAVVALTFFYVQQFRGKALVPADLFAASTALSVIENYNFCTTDAILSALLLYLLAGGTILILKRERKGSFAKFVKRTGICVVMWTVFIFGLRFSDGGFWNSYINYWNTNEAYKEQGTLLSFVRLVNNMVMEKPEGYSRNIVADLKEQSIDIQNNVKYPNLIVVMDEALADFSEECDYEDALPFMHTLQKNTVKGNMYVSVMGGSTANTEYEFLTGCTMSFFPSGSIPYAQYIREDTDSFAKQLKNYGYTTVAVHPYYATGYFRNTVYPKLGFDQSLFLEDFDDPDYLGPYVSDKSSFDKVISLYEQRNGNIFIFNVTMQNHSGYTVRNFEKTISVDAGTKKFEDAEEYLTATRETDRALQGLIEYLEKEQEDVAVVIFGDHRPALSEDFYSFLEADMQGEELEIREKSEFRVPFLIWANYDIGEKENVEISANYLSAYMAQILSMPMTGYQQYLNELREEIPVMNIAGYKGSDGKWHYYGEDNEYKRLIDEYKIVQYNDVHDKKGKVLRFFEP